MQSFCRLLCSFKEWVPDILKDILSAFLIGVFLYLIQHLRYLIHFYLRFNDRIFNVYSKNNKDGKPDRTVRCKVRGNKIKYSGESFEGQFIINPIDLKTGTGYHYHENYIGFNFPKIIIKDRETFLIETSYVDDKFQIHYQAFRWDKEK